MLYPAYLESYHNGSLSRIIKEGYKMLESCSICPRKCKVNRLKNERGLCRTGVKPILYSFMPHHGEEPPISGKLGSGAIFFSNCNMACVYCQNYEFSQKGKGREVEPEELARFMLDLQARGCHNINLVTPTHVMPQILRALELAIPEGLKIPLVYNTSGYELAEIIKLLKGIVDIYLPDMRYADSEIAMKYSIAADYPRYNQEAIKQMYEQVGIAEMDDGGIIRKGLIIRHLVLPENLSDTDKVLRFIAEEISEYTYVSLMSQYHPYYKAFQFKEISHCLEYEKYQEAQALMQKYGLYNGWIQESYGLERFAGTNIKPV